MGLSRRKQILLKQATSHLLHLAIPMPLVEYLSLISSQWIITR